MLITPEEFAKIWAEVDSQMSPTTLALHLTRLEFDPGGVDHKSLFELHKQWFADNPRRNAMMRRAVRGEHDNIPYSEKQAHHFFDFESYPKLQLQKAPELSPFVRSIWRKVPPLWVKVQKLRKGTFESSAVWRGSAFFPVTTYRDIEIGVFKSDDALYDVYETMNNYEGTCLEEMQKFQQYIYEISAAQVGKPKQIETSKKPKEWMH